MRSYKIEIKPTKEQILKIENTSNVCRFIYNEMIATNELLYEMSRLIGSEKQFMGANDFSKYINNKLCNPEKTDGIGVDLGIKELAFSSTGEKFKNINKTKVVKKLEKKLKRKQKSLSKKFENLKLKKNGGGTVTKKNIEKNVLSVQKINYRLSNIRTEYTKKVVNTLVRTKPEYITIEDLNASINLRDCKKYKILT